MRRFVLIVLVSILAALNVAPVVASDGVLIFGATRNTGLEIAKILVARGEPVTAFVRPVSNLENLEPLNVDYFTGDALNADEVKAAVRSKDFSAVISTLGGGRGETPPDLVGTINIIDAMEMADVKRADLADLVVGAYDDPSTIGKVYQVIGDDPLAVRRMDQQ